MSVTFHQPRFDKNIQDKIGSNVEVVDGSGHCIRNTSDSYGGYHAISSNGFPSKVDGTHVFVTQIDEIRDCTMCIGWTSNATYDSSRFARPGSKMSGCSLWLDDGETEPGYDQSVPREISKKAKEVVSILTISENGKKITAQWIVDGTEGVVHDVSGEFKNGGSHILPAVALGEMHQQIQTIPLSQLKSTSPKIEELKKKMNTPVAVAPTSLTNNEENEKVIQQLRQDLENAQKRLVDQKDKQIEEMKAILREQLEAKDRVLETKDKIVAQKENELTSKNQEIQMKDKQLELERAEHQKTRNLLHQKTTEMKDMEIHFLKEQNKILMQKESGQRREREEGEEMSVKQERSD